MNSFYILSLFFFNEFGLKFVIFSVSKNNKNLKTQTFSCMEEVKK